MPNREIFVPNRAIFVFVGLSVEQVGCHNALALANHFLHAAHSKCDNI